MKITLLKQSFFKTIVRNILLFCLSVFLFSCGPARHVKEGNYLLTKVKIDSEKNKSINGNLQKLAKQKPNRKLLGLFKIYLGIYNLYYERETNKLNEEKGEAPVIYDSTLHESSMGLMRKYLNNLGYYENEISFTSKKSKKRAKVIYHIEKKERYHIEHIKYDIKDDSIKSIFLRDTSQRRVKIGSNFDFNLLQSERKRIENLLKDHGYYEFSKEFVSYRADTSQDNNSASINLVIKQRQVQQEPTDTISLEKHLKYSINNIYVRMDYDLQLDGYNNPDTTKVGDFIFIEKAEKKFKYDVISRAIYLRHGQLYSLTKQEQSYRNLTSLGVFSYVSIKYEKDYTTPENDLNVYIDLNPNKKKAYTVLAEGTNNGGNFGVNGDVSFLNRNLFKGAELFKIRLNAGMEVQQILTEDNNDDETNVLPFNTVEFGPEISLDVPRFLLPFKLNEFSNRIKPTTSFGIAYNYQNRPDYSRNITSTYINYSWNESKTKTHIITPFELSFTKLDKTPEFEEVLEDIENPFLRNSYTDNLILGVRYTFIFSTQDANRAKDDFFLRYNVESAGNLLSLATSPNPNNSNEDGSVNIADIRFAQFLRNDIDFRYYDNYEFSQAVYRIAIGLGIPYGNSVALPFEKSYFAGGANGIRAWLPRELGPGNLPDSANNVDQIGNMKIEGNLEYRFSITPVLEGAIFADFGNIWNYNQEDSREDTQFKVGEIWNGLAIGTGIGVRLNFSFFILRFDVATRLKDPARPDPTILKYEWDETLLNFGIGYPF